MAAFDEDDDEYRRVLELSIEEQQGFEEGEEEEFRRVLEISQREAERQETERKAQEAVQNLALLELERQQQERDREHHLQNVQQDQSDARELALAIAESMKLQAARIEDVDDDKDIEMDIEIPPELFNLGQQLFIQLEKIYGVKLRFSYRLKRCWITGKQYAVEIAKNELATEYFNSADLDTCKIKLHSQLAKAQEQTLHIFVDNSNIYLGSKWIYNSITCQSEPDFTVRINTGTLSNIVINARKNNVAQKIVYGSAPPRNNAIWSKWEQIGYEVSVFQRTPGMGEQMVDDALIARINQAILSYPGGHTLVLLTGDGNLNGGRASFQNSVILAIQHGWKVELWAWRLTINKIYFEMEKSYAGQNVFSIFCLDDYRDKITFNQPVWDPSAPAGEGGRGRGRGRGGRDGRGRGSRGRGGRDGRGGRGRRGRGSFGRGGREGVGRGALVNGNQAEEVEEKEEEDVVYEDEEEEEEDFDWVNCPISLNVMVDPVRTIYGHYFERASIMRWLGAGRDSCPCTRRPLRPEDILEPEPGFVRRLEEYRANNQDV